MMNRVSEAVAEWFAAEVHHATIVLYDDKNNLLELRELGEVSAGQRFEGISIRSDNRKVRWKTHHIHIEFYNAEGDLLMTSRANEINAWDVLNFQVPKETPITFE